MKIAFLTPEYPHARTGNSGGIGTSIMNLAKGLVMNGDQVIVLVYGQKEDEVFEENGIQFYRIKNVKIKGLSWFLTRKKIQKLINSLYSQGKIDLVEAPDWTGISSYIKTNCPLIIRENGSDTYFCHLDGRKVKWINRHHEKQALKQADSIIAVSSFTGNLTNKLFNLKRNFTVIPNCINADFFTKDTESAAVDHLTILYFGSLIRKKGLLELPHIFNKVIEQNPNAKLVLTGKDVPDIISGNPSTWSMMKGLFSEKAIANVAYLGSVPYDTIKNHIQRAKVCVFPSFAEALPVSWLEAMAMQKPIVASNIGWANEMIEDGISGFLAHPTDHELFASKIVLLLDSDNLSVTIGDNARKKIKEVFDVQKVVHQNIVFYKSVIN